MSVWFYLYGTLCLFALILSFFSYFKAPCSSKIRGLLFSLRTLFTLLLITAFIEPVIHFERLPEISQTVPVLIDNSKSMRLFNPESTILPFLETLRSINNIHQHNKPLFSLLSFGDSLRTIKKHDGQFYDVTSTFPVASTARIMSKAQSLIIVSDGNWTNTYSLPDYNENRTIYYMKLPAPQPIPLLSLLGHAPQYTSTDSTIHIECLTSGYASTSSNLTISCFEQNKLLAQSIIAVDSGNINNTIPLRVRFHTPGNHLLRISAALNDSMRTEYRYVLDVIPKTLTYRSSSSVPSLDNRFIMLALENNSSFSKSKVPTDSSDLLIVTRWSSENNHALSLQKKQGLVLFAGCLPCTTLQVYSTTGFLINMSRYSPANRIETASLPPASFIKSCMQSPLNDVYAWATYRNGTKSDTMPALFTTTVANKKHLVLSIRDFWKWDFIPLISAQGEEHTFSFSRRIIETARDIILSSSSDNYIAFPENSSVESDSITINHSLPGTIPYNSTIKIHFTLSSLSRTMIDTSFTNTVTGTRSESFLIPPIPSGIYHYTSSITAKTQQYTYSDSFFISKDNREYSVRNQNEFILNEIGHPLARTDSAALITLFNTDNLTLRAPIKETFHIQRNWIMLITIFILYSTELIIRRKNSLD